MIFYQKDTRYFFQDGSINFSIDTDLVDMQDFGTQMEFTFERWIPTASRDKVTKYYAYANIFDRDGNVYGTTFEQVHDGIHKGFEVMLQDQNTDVIIQKFNLVTNSTTLNGAIAIDDRTLVVTDATGIVVGTHLILFDPASLRFTTVHVLGVSVNTVTFDRPIDFAYPDGTYIDVAVTNMAVNGATTPVIFGIRGTGSPPGVDLTFDMTRIVITMLTTGAPAYDLFGDQAALTNGVLFRKRNGRTFNIFNVKTNGEWAGIMYDLSAADKVNPSQGQNGWIGRMTFAGQEKMGVSIRLPVGEDAQFVIQDDLTAIELLEITAEGHIVKP